MVNAARGVIVFRVAHCMLILPGLQLFCVPHPGTSNDSIDSSVRDEEIPENYPSAGYSYCVKMDNILATHLVAIITRWSFAR